MIAIFYLFLCCTTGMLIVHLLRKFFITKDFKQHFSRWMFYIPAGFVIGVLVCGWLTYIVSYIFASSPKPLSWGNLVVIPLQIAATIYLYHLKKDYIFRLRNVKFKKFLKKNYIAFTLVAFAIVYISIITIQSFHYDGPLLKMGYSTFSDFGPHVAVMRSFSQGSNFPTQYLHFPDGTIRYHFMFQFFCGNLEFLGLPIDLAINIPSIIAFAFFVLLFYYLVTIITQKKAIALIACLLFFFRSSLTFIDYLKESPDNIFKALINSQIFIGTTTNESWGLWTSNVYINQRHLPFALCALVLILIALLPPFNQMMLALSKHKGKRFKTFIASKEAWLPASYTRAIVCGVLAGSIGFWNGAVFITLLLMLFIIAICSKHRLEFLIVAIISCALFLLQLRFFAGSGATDTGSIIQLGFLTDFSTLPEEIITKIHSITTVSSLFASLSLMPTVIFHVTKTYIVPLLGLMPIITILGLIVSRKGTRLLSLAFLAPFVFSFIFSITPDVTVNHKYIMISVAFVSIFCAVFIYYLLTITKRIKFKNITINVLGKLVAIVLVIALTTTGFIDYFTAINQNKNHVSISQEDVVYLWVKENTPPQAVFLTDTAVLDPYLFAGRNISSGHGYFAWSAGYDFGTRDALITQTYLSSTPDKLRENATKLGVDYIVVSDSVRDMMKLREHPDFTDDVIKETYPEVFNYEDVTIYQVN